MQQYVDQNVELGYAFDVHCNAFFPLLTILHVLQIVLIHGGVSLPSAHVGAPPARSRRPLMFPSLPS